MPHNAHNAILFAVLEDTFCTLGKSNDEGNQRNVWFGCKEYCHNNQFKIEFQVPFYF